MKKNQFTSLRGLFAAVFAAVCVVFVACTAEQFNDIKPEPTGDINKWNFQLNILNCDGDAVAYSEVEKKEQLISIPVAQQGVPTVTSQSNPTPMDNYTEYSIGTSDGQLWTLRVYNIGGYKVTAHVERMRAEALPTSNPRMTLIRTYFKFYGYYVNEKYEGGGQTTPFECEFYRDYMQGDESVEVRVDTVTNYVDRERVVDHYHTDTLTVYEIQYVYEYVHDTTFVERLKVDTMMVDRIVEKEVIKVVNHTDTLWREKIVEVPVEKTVYVEVPVTVRDTTTVVVHDTTTVTKTVEVEKFVNKYIKLHTDTKSKFGEGAATATQDGEKLLTFNITCLYSMLEVEKANFGKAAFKSSDDKTIYATDGQVFKWNATTKNATIESVELVGIKFQKMPIDVVMWGEAEFVVKGYYVDIEGNPEAFEFDVELYYLHCCKAEPEIKVDVYTYEFTSEDVAGSNPAQWTKNFSVKRLLNGSVDKTWSYKAWVAKVGHIGGTHYHVSDVAPVEESYEEGTSSRKYADECKHTVLEGKNLGFVVDTDCRLYRYTTTFPSTANGTVATDNELVYWVKEISFADPERPDDENGRHTWSFGKQSCHVTKNQLENDPSAEATFNFSEGKSTVVGNYATSHVLTVTAELDGKGWYSQSAVTHLYK